MIKNFTILKFLYVSTYLILNEHMVVVAYPIQLNLIYLSAMFYTSKINAHSQ